jgi:hypothetical protein
MSNRPFAFEQLEDRHMMDNASITTEYLPIARGTAEASSPQWTVARGSDYATTVHAFETDQAGSQRHLWTGNFYAWEGIAEFETDLPVGAIIDGATLRVEVVNKEDSMNHRPSLVVHASRQQAQWAITPIEYNNAQAQVGSVAFDDVRVGETVDIPLDPASIPANGITSFTLRASDQVAGLEPTADHNSRSVFTYANTKLDVRYHLPETDATESPDSFRVPDEVVTLVAEAARMAEPDETWASPEAGHTTTRTLTNGIEHISLRGSPGMVRGIRAVVTPANENATVTVRVYRGAEEIDVISLPMGGGRFDYENDEGFTDVVFVPSVRTPLTIGRTETSVIPGMAAASGTALTPFTSTSFGAATAPIVPMPTNVATAAQKLNLTTTVGGSGEKYFYGQRDPSKFTLYRITYTKGSGRIASVGTIQKTGVDYMGRETYSTSGFPDGYMMRIDDNTVAIAPGAPRLISFVGGFSGATATLTMKEGATLESILPPNLMTSATVRASVLRMEDQFHEEGVYPGVTEVRGDTSIIFAKPGHRANMWYQVRNEALQGGALTFEVYVGWYAGEPQRGTLQNSFQTSIGGGQSIKVSVNVTAPNRPADATSDRPIISFVTRLANGQSVIKEKAGQLPKSMDGRVITQGADGHPIISYVSKDYTEREQARIRELTDRALMSLLNSPDNRLIAIRETLGDDHIVQLLAESAAAAKASIAGMTDPKEAVNTSIRTTNTVLQDQIDPAYVAANGDFIYDPYKGSVPTESTISSSISSHLPRKNIGIGQSEVNSSLPLHVNKSQSAKIPFDLTEKKMVNFSIEANDVALRVTNLYSPISIPPAELKANIRMILTGTTNEGYPVMWSAAKIAGSGESMSGMLTPGTYQLEIFDDTDYSSVPNITGEPLTLASIGLKALPLNFSIVPHNSANIEGRMSVEGSSKVMPVSMRVAEFDPITKLRLETPQNSLQPDKPIWVVIHGRTDSEDGKPINDLARSLYEYADGHFQVVTLNWEEGAKDLTTTPLFNKFDLEDAKWTPAVGKWAAQQLLAVGFAPSIIHVGAHSHGTFAGFFMGQHIVDMTEQKIGSIVALDSAKNPIFIGANISEESIVFRDVAEESISIHSSVLGSTNRAHGAERAIGVSSPDTLSPLLEHGYAVSMFADALDDLRTGQNLSIASIFSINANGMISTASIVDAVGYDVWISVRSALSDDGSWRKSQASALWKKKPDGTWDNAIFDPIFTNSIPVVSTPTSSEGSLIY